jgi:cation diffusion facilitator CzcD-associated flavoprotein CzcO
MKMEEKVETRFSDVVIIGAGFSGINAACQLQRKLCTTDYVIYEREPGFGGAWFANNCRLSLLAFGDATKERR